MPVSSLDGQVSIQDPRNPVLQEVTNHPDYRVIAAFFLGWVLISGAYCALNSKVIRELAGWGTRLCMGKRGKKSLNDIEAAADQETDGEKGDDDAARVPTQQDVDTNASLFILNLCFVLAALASFCSLLNLGGQKGNSIACTVVIAWSSMASQSVRIVGLLILTWRLRHLGIKRLELYALWFGLLVVLGLVLAVNATGTGAVSVFGSSGVSICYRQYFWPVSLSLSGVVMFVEIYVAVRLFILGTPRSATWTGFLHRIFSIEMARPMSLFALDVASVVQAAIWVNSLAQYIPFSLTALLVIGVFNHTGGGRQGVTCVEVLPESHRISALTDERRYSAQRPNSLLEPSPFLVQFMDQPMAPDSHTHAFPVQSRSIAIQNGGQDGDLVLHISATSHENGDAGNFEQPHSAPANLTDTPQPLPCGPRHILPFQVQYVERLEREAATLTTGPVPPRRDRPKVFVVIDEDEQGTPVSSARNSRSRASIIGSDIILTTPTTPKKHKLSRLWSPDSAAPSTFPYTSPHESRLTDRTQMTSFSTYPHVERSPTVQSEHPDTHLSPQSDYISPGEPSQRYSWRIGTTRHQSVSSSRTVQREELPTVMEGSSNIRTSSTPSRTSGRVVTRRMTFGQPVRPPPRKLSIAAVSPAAASPPALPHVQSAGSLREAVSPLLSPDVPDVPPLPPMPSPLTSPGTTAALLSPVSSSGPRNVRGPRPPPAAISSPATSPRVAEAGENLATSQKTDDAIA